MAKMGISPSRGISRAADEKDVDGLEDEWRTGPKPWRTSKDGLTKKDRKGDRPQSAGPKRRVDAGTAALSRSQAPLSRATKLRGLIRPRQVEGKAKLNDSSLSPAYGRASAGATKPLPPQAHGAFSSPSPTPASPSQYSRPRSRSTPLHLAWPRSRKSKSPSPSAAECSVHRGRARSPAQQWEQVRATSEARLSSRERGIGAHF